MSSRMDDLAPLLVPAGGAGDVGFASGTVESWNSATGENTVRVAGALLANVPILNTGEAIALQAGHVVAMLRFKSSYFILGRVTIPGSAQFASSSVDFDASGHLETNFNIGTTDSVKTSVALSWPAWANEAVVFITGHAHVVNNSGGSSHLGVRPQFEGFQGATSWVTVPAGATGHAAVSQTAVLPRNEGSGDQINVDLIVKSTTAGWSANASNMADIHAMAVFRSTT